VAWPPRLRISKPFHPRGSLRILEGRAPVHALRCQRETRFSGPRCRLPTSATVKRRASTPYERSILAREWGFRPATRRHQPMPVALARDTLPHRGPASHDLHAPACARRVPLAWTRQIEGRSVRVKASRALLDDVARALLVAPRAPCVAGSIRHEAWRTPSLAAPA